jgi:hypothetical protein
MIPHRNTQPAATTVAMLLYMTVHSTFHVLRNKDNKQIVFIMVRHNILRRTLLCLLRLMALDLAMLLELDSGPTTPLVCVSRSSLSHVIHPIGILFNDASRALCLPAQVGIWKAAWKMSHRNHSNNNPEEEAGASLKMGIASRSITSELPLFSLSLSSFLLIIIVIHCRHNVAEHVSCNR